MEEQLITFKTAILSKHKGFDVPVKFGVYGVKMKLTHFHKKGVFENVNWNAKEKQQSHSKATSIPTQSLLQKWLRDNHKVSIQINDYRDALKGECFSFRVKKLHNYTDVDFDGYFKTYEEALEEALYEGLSLI